jgi:sugar phosphate isomerase/epimerase
MASTMKGAGIFLAQFAGDTAPFDTLEGIAAWAAGRGYDAVQIPTFDTRLFDLDQAATSRAYCDEVKGICAEAGVAISELSTHLQGQLVAVHPAYDLAFDAFAPASLHGNPTARQEWAVDQMLKAAKAARNLGIDTTVSFSGSLAFPYVYPWPQRPQGLVDEAFAELARRWRPILDAYEDEGVDIGFEIHPGEDLFDGTTYERFVEATGDHDRALINYDPSHFLLQQLDYLGFIDFYHDRICAFHVKDAEFNPTARQGVHSGYSDWTGRAARFRSLGDGQVDFAGIFSRLCQYGYDGFAVLEWECCLKSPEQGAAEGAPFIHRHIIEATDKAFDDFAGGDTDTAKIRKMLGVSA